jgi:diguanylate cyclase (GGDEF)-like protein
VQKPTIVLSEILQHQLKSCRTLPSVPAVVVRVLQLSQEEETSINEIAQVVSRDPALTTKLLRVSNSAFYAARYEVTTVNRAVSVLGINATLSLALSFSLAKNLRESGAKGFDSVACWRRSAIAAAAGRALAELANKNMREELFLSGLLQDVGMLVLSEAIPDIYGDLVATAQGSHRKLVELERERLGSDHAAVGAWLLERWNIPERYQLAIAASHDPTVVEESEFAAFCRATAVAGDIAEIWTDPATATGIARDSAIGLMKISPERFESLLGEIAEAIPEITSELDINIGSEEKVTSLLEQAREALVALSMRAQQQMQQIQDLSRQDRLTSVYNRSFLDEELPRQFELASQSGEPLSVLFVDIDYFKNVNDTYGHEAGDYVLVSLAGILQIEVRPSDIIARYGGEEFICIMPGTSLQEAAAVAERLRATIVSKPQLIGDDVKIQITVSVGCATFSSKRPFDDSKQLLKEADRCLYAAKAKGRNRVVTMESTAEYFDAQGCASHQGSGNLLFPNTGVSILMPSCSVVLDRTFNY